MSAAAGWYPDAKVPGGERYWDGQQWTEHRRDGEGRVPLPQPTAQPAPGWYDDPNMVNTRRYWDGQEWTEHRQEKAGTPAAVAAVPPSGGTSNLPKWVISGFGALLVVLAVWLLAGNGWQTITGGGTTIDVEAMQADIETSMAEQDVPGFTITCDDPGETTKGDITYCRGKNKQGVPVTIKVTFEDDGNYTWETLH